MNTTLITVAFCLPLLASGAPRNKSGPAPLSHARYRLLCGEQRVPPPVEVVDFAYGPSRAGESGEGVGWQLTVSATETPDDEPLFILRAVTRTDPLASRDRPLEFLRYRLRVAADGPALEYRDVHTGRPLLPAWSSFSLHFVPRPARNTGRQGGFPNTCAYLGHVLTLRWHADGGAWKEWPDAKVLELDPELLIGTGRTVKDAEGHRLPQTPERQNYTYVQWTPDDYRTMIDAGMNLFGVVPSARNLVVAEAVFHRGGAQGLSLPGDLYRSNYVGPMMYLDEPTCILVGDRHVHNTLKYFTDAAVLIEKRVRGLYRRGKNNLAEQVRGRGFSLGDMRLEQPDFASWETRYETAFYQLAGGLAGIVHEGRYQLDEFNEFARASTGFDREYTPEEMFRYYFAHLRGAARHFDKHWGISIYGQADPEITPLAMRLAYDMGARYLWYWTSDHDHHLPWPEQLELTRKLKDHAREHPRPSIRGPRPTLDKVIVIPYGYFLVLESPTNRRNPWDLWWVRELDPAGQNESSHRYRRLMQQALTEVQKSLDAGEEFDFTVDDGRPIEGYRKIVRLEVE